MILLGEHRVGISSGYMCQIAVMGVEGRGACNNKFVCLRGGYADWKCPYWCPYDHRRRFSLAFTCSHWFQRHLIGANDIVGQFE